MTDEVFDPDDPQIAASQIALQIRWMYRYMCERYGGPDKSRRLAFNFFDDYYRGGKLPPGEADPS